MTICQYFLEGRCRYGQNCRFEHSYNNDDRNTRNSANTQQLSNAIKQIVGEVILAEKGGQWPLSCYSPIKELPSIPGWEDISPEEVRWKMYQARANGTLNQCINEINQLHRNAEKNRNLLKQPTMDRINIIENVLKGNKDTSNASNPFATNSKLNTSTSTNIFGGSGQSSIFGGTQQPAGPHGSIFGGSPQSTTVQGSIFGGSPPSNQGSIFGGNNTTFSNQNIFGGNSSPTGFNQNVFSSPQASNQNMFSGSSTVGSGNIFSNIPASTQGIFSNVRGGSQSPTPNAFSTPTSSGGFSNQGATTPVFGSQNAFFQNANKTPTQTNIFGGGQNDNMFKSQNSFGKTGDVFASQGSIFGGQSSPAGNQRRPSAMDSSVYSKTEDLSEEDIKSFTAPTFTFGKIPLKPPAQEYCN